MCSRCDAFALATACDANAPPPVDSTLLARSSEQARKARAEQMRRQRLDSGIGTEPPKQAEDSKWTSLG
jgi:hypothetical protein